MDVTTKNFTKIISLVTSRVSNCDFMAIDMEFSGLGPSETNRLSIDSIEQRYKTLTESAKQFVPVQFGVCTFHWEKNLKKWIAHPFNFYIFPRSFKNLTRDFLCNPSSLQFLCEHKFDFNTWINEGIGYLSRDDAAKLKKEISSKMQFNTESNDVTLTPADQLFIDEIRNAVEKWLHRSTEKKLVFNQPYNSYQRRIIYQELKKSFQNQIFIESVPIKNDPYRRTIEIVRIDEVEKKQLENEKIQQALKEVEDAVGFRRVVDAIIESRKPLLGHNFLVDCIQIVTQFKGSPAPTCAEFKQQLHELFPVILDTKFLAYEHPALSALLPNTSLHEIHERIKSPPFKYPSIEFRKKFKRYSNEAHFHEAGYDAFITGVVFIAMTTHIIGDSKTATITPLHPSLCDFINKLFLMHNNIPFLNLTGPDESPEKRNVFYVYGFNSETKTNDIVSHFSKYGKIAVKWINSYDAFITVIGETSNNSNKRDATQEKWQISEDVQQQILNDKKYNVIDYQTYITNYKTFGSQQKSGNTMDNSSHKL